MKKILVLVALVSITFPSTTVTLAAPNQVLLAESLHELSIAEAKLNSIVRSAVNGEIDQFSLDLKRGNSNSDSIKQKINKLKQIEGYRDLQTNQSLEEALRELSAKGYQPDTDFLEVCKEIVSYKRDTGVTDPKDVVRHFNELAGLENDISSSLLSLNVSLNSVAQAYSISYSSWTKLTTSEKLLIASNPVAALQTNAIQKKAYEYTSAKFGSNGLGDKSDGYRHGIWNALMTRDISRAWAEAISTAHEDRPKSELDAKQSDGYYGWQHKNMDLNNNKVGRSVIAWYEYSINCSDSTVKSRISAKLTNKSGEIIWLHN